MSSTTVCDYCHQPINHGDDRVDLNVFDRSPILPGTAAMKPKERLAEIAKWNAQERITLTLDLHRTCYVEHIQPALPTAPT